MRVFAAIGIGLAALFLLDWNAEHTHVAALLHLAPQMVRWR
jgi:hypothetical protein